jgi:hypothetical protein
LVVAAFGGGAAILATMFLTWIIDLAGRKKRLRFPTRQ